MNETHLNQQVLDQFRAAVVRHCLSQMACGFGSADSERGGEARRWFAETTLLQINKLCVGDLIDSEQLFSCLELALKSKDFQATATELFSQFWSLSVDRIGQTQSPITAGLDKPAFVEAFVEIASHSELKSRLVQALVHNQQYQEMISGVIIQVLGRFFQDESIFSKLPGVGHFVKMGRWGVGKMLPQWGAILEGLAQNFINTNLQMVLRLSEAFLLERLSNENLTVLAEQLWQTLANQPVSRFRFVTEAVNSQAVKVWSAAHLEVFLNGPLWHELTRPILNDLFEHLCRVRIGRFLVYLQLPQETVLAACEKIWALVLEALAESDEVNKLLDEVLAPCFTLAFFTEATGSGC